MTYAKTEAGIARLTREQYRVTQEGETERPYTGKYHDHWEAGLYVDIVSGEPLFASSAKYDCGSGWASFTRPVEPANIRQLRDIGHGLPRMQVRSVHADSQLGHVFDDGPAEQGGLRYCINSAALRFVARDQMKAAGYGQYLKQVDEVPAIAEPAPLDVAAAPG